MDKHFYERHRLEPAIMKILCFVLTFCITGVYAIRGAETNGFKWGPIAGNFQMSVRLRDGGNEIKTNQPVDLMIRLRNLSTNESYNFIYGGALSVPTPGEFSLEVISPSGKNICKYPKYSNGGSSVWAHVPPHGTWEQEFPLGRLIEYETNDVYKIVVRRMIHTNVVVISNPLYLKVVPGKFAEPKSTIGFP